MNFADAAKNNGLTYTENGALAYNSTGDALVNLFSTVGALREKEYAEVEKVFFDALEEDALLAVKIMFYARNIRSGLGERDTFRKMLLALATKRPDAVIKNISLIPVFGRWDDLYTLVGTPVEKEMWKFMSEQFFTDVIGMMNHEPISLCAKWMKSINTSSAESRELGKKTAQALGYNERKYRQILSRLRAHIKIVEQSMSSGNWKGIDYSHVPARAMKLYRKAFQRHDGDRFSSFLGKVEKGESKINAGTLYPYDILMSANLAYGSPSFWGRIKPDFFSMDSDPVLEAQWKALPNYVEGENNVLVMADTSASMEGLPMATAIGLAVYFAERNKGAYKDLFLTFSGEPRFVQLSGNTLAEKVSKIESLVSNTNLEKAFELILATAIENKVAQEEMPKSLVVISDMQFDSAIAEYFSITARTQVLSKTIKDNYRKAGYSMPTVIYWQVAERQKAFPVRAHDENVIMVSGHSTSTFKNVLGLIAKTPFEFMLEVLSDPIYDMIVV